LRFVKQPDPSLVKIIPFRLEPPLPFKKQPKPLPFSTIKNQSIRITFKKSFPTFYAIAFSPKMLPIAITFFKQF
jgi:hypothetical protein